MRKAGDAIELEIFRNLFISIAEEMGAVLGRTGLSPNIKERKDYSCAVFNRRGETLAQGSHIPVHLGAMPLSVQAALGALTFEDGDLVLVNDPYRGGTHLPDITAIAPVFVGGRPAFFTANRAHHSDVGGMSPGSMPLATEIFQEGLILPPLKLVARGRLNEDVLNLILANVRTPEERRGDLLAQIAACEKGRVRVLEAVEKFGLDQVDRYAGLIQDYTEIFLRKTLRTISPGTYAYADFLDDDGITKEPVRISVRITVRGGRAKIDFRGSSPQVKGGVNANAAVTISAVLYVFRSLIEEDIPVNTGLLRPLEIVAPPGLIVSARFPAATAAGNVETSQRIVDVLLGALAKAMPGRIPAASQGTMNNIALGGIDPVRGRSFAYYETLGGGMGASRGRSGLSGVHTHMTNSLNTPLESLEKYLPLRIRAYSLRPGSGGAGASRGGDGLIREYEFSVSTRVTIMSERRIFPPYGLAGGGPGRRGRNILISKGRRTVLGSKSDVTVQAGDIIRIETPGGGGYGPPARKKESR
ncbi:MAG TPA: hydantoinase B/oxoprolinase family protein [Candidatus Aminicenantes bacterium]|nr:hydantoinase B/oxoprolinase family protein [Candidatus Aminicenantes bacterium]HOS10876.1 hydantoinase B/oxoprolinase family protein [Candidatus Aminicenantes bacterium]HPL12858.1 hydantoinase B/oxoprolinase family protein [Candidatus Aminicenantes bacterium]